MPIIGATDIQPMNVLEQYAKGLEVGAAERALERQEVDRIKAAEQNRALNEMYARAMKPGGQVDVNALYGMLASGGMGAMIPGMQAQQADVASKQAQARKNLSDIEVAQFKNQRDLLVPVTDQAGFDVWRTGALKTYAGIPGIETIIPAKFSPEVKDQLLLTADQVVGRMPMSPEKFAQEKALRDAGRSQQVVHLPPAESAYQTGAGKQAIDRDFSLYTAASNVPEALTKVNQTLSLIDQGAPITGAAAELQLNFERLGSLVTGRPNKKVEDTELLDALLGSDVFPLIQQLGIGSKGLDTPAEREYLRKVIAGTITLNQNTLRRMAVIRGNVQRRLAERFNSRVDSGELDRFFKSTGYPKRKIEIPDMPIPASAVDRLKKNPSVQSKLQFDEVFGDGAADRVLSAGK